MIRIFYHIVNDASQQMLEEKYKRENIMTIPHLTNLENNVLLYRYIFCYNTLCLLCI